MPKVRILVFLGFLFLFAAIPFFGKKDAIKMPPSFSAYSQNQDFMYENEGVVVSFPEVRAQLTPGVSR